MSADIIPLPPPQDSAPANITPLPAPPAPAEPDALAKLLKNPYVLAGGALLAGMALARLFTTPSVQKLARELADEALKRTARDGDPAAPGAAPAPAAAPTLLQEALHAVRPQIAEAAQSFLAQVLKRP